MILQQIQSKIQTWEQAHQTVQQWQAQQEKIVFTNGCFDLLHYGHLHYLASARSIGDRLIIGLNADSSVKRLKGLHRPIHEEHTRLHMLAAFSFVDLVVSFDQDTPLELIQLLVPNILVKGGDWSIDKIIGADLVLKNGGTVKSLPFIDGYSTTAIEQKIWSQKPQS